MSVLVCINVRLNNLTHMFEILCFAGLLLLPSEFPHGRGGGHLYYIAPYGEPGQLVGKSAGLVIERLRVRIPAGAAGEFSSPGLSFCADSCSVSVPPPCDCSGT